MACETGHVHEHVDTGKESLLGELPIYEKDPKEKTNKGVVLAFDIFGFSKSNTRKFVDNLAAHGFHTVMPNFFRGSTLNMEKDKENFREWLKTVPQERFSADLQVSIDYLHSKGVTSIGIVGFCWGGKQALLAGLHNPNIKSIVSIHGSRISLEEVEQLKVTALFLHAEIDQGYPEELVTNLKKLLGERFKVFPGVSHGFALRGDPNDPVVTKAAEEAFNDTVHWFASHL